jgi:hypothetical protein
MGVCPFVIRLITAPCSDSCDTQAWSMGTLLGILVNCKTNSRFDARYECVGVVEIIFFLAYCCSLIQSMALELSYIDIVC